MQFDQEWRRVVPPLQIENLPCCRVDYRLKTMVLLVRKARQRAIAIVQPTSTPVTQSAIICKILMAGTDMCRNIIYLVSCLAHGKVKEFETNWRLVTLYILKLVV